MRKTGLAQNHKDLDSSKSHFRSGFLNLKKKKKKKRFDRSRTSLSKSQMTDKQLFCCWPPIKGRKLGTKSKKGKREKTPFTFTFLISASINQSYEIKTS